MNLKEYKEKYKLKNADLARMIGVSPSTLHHWLSGKAKPNLSHGALIQLTSKGEITIEDLGLEAKVRDKKCDEWKKKKLKKVKNILKEVFDVA